MQVFGRWESARIPLLSPPHASSAVHFLLYSPARAATRSTTAPNLTSTIRRLPAPPPTTYLPPHPQSRERLKRVSSQPLAKRSTSPVMNSPPCFRASCGAPSSRTLWRSGRMRCARSRREATSSTEALPSTAATRPPCVICPVEGPFCHRVRRMAAEQSPDAKCSPNRPSALAPSFWTPLKHGCTVTLSSAERRLFAGQPAGCLRANIIPPTLRPPTARARNQKRLPCGSGAVGATLLLCLGLRLLALSLGQQS